jgi:hypothetical protein
MSGALISRGKFGVGAYLNHIFIDLGSSPMPGFFNIDRLEDVVWNDDAFQQLVLNSDQKRLIWALAKQKSIDDAEFDDFISGKGSAFDPDLFS